jgi:hypothetical protein
MAVKLTTYLHQVWKFGMREIVYLFLPIQLLVFNYVQRQIGLK